MHGGEGLDGEEVRHVHGGGEGDAGEVVAEQINDHEVLCTVLLTGTACGEMGGWGRKG